LGKNFAKMDFKENRCRHFLGWVFLVIGFLLLINISWGMYKTNWPIENLTVSRNSLYTESDSPDIQVEKITSFELELSAVINWVIAIVMIIFGMILLEWQLKPNLKIIENFVRFLFILFVEIIIVYFFLLLLKREWDWRFFLLVILTIYIFYLLIQQAEKDKG